MMLADTARQSVRGIGACRGRPLRAGPADE